MPSGDDAGERALDVSSSSQRGVAFGAGYADVHAQLPVLQALMVLAGLVAVLSW